MKGEWVNTTVVRHPELEKPCVKLNYCPYGQLVEEFTLHSPQTELSCSVFGHDCPVHYHAETPKDFGIEEWKKQKKGGTNEIHTGWETLGHR